MDRKRYKPSTYLVDCLRLYIPKIILGSSKHNSDQDLEKELIFVLGSLFYPKIIKLQPQYQNKETEIA
jgi:hypothetical protein